MDFEAPSEVASRTVYGSDDRTEYFQLQSEWRALMAASTVALIPRVHIDPTERRLAAGVPSWRAASHLCAGEPFADQPAAAFCTGVLIDWDLVLTAGHCLRLFALQDFAVVFGYYNAATGKLAVEDGDILDPLEVVSEALDREGLTPRLDYAWLRLRRAVTAPRRPLPIRIGTQGLEVGDFVASIGAVGGVPLKFDGGGRLRDLRSATSDYFIADTDTSGGSSGGGAFDQQGSLLGILARGGPDFIPDRTGCNRNVYEPDGLKAQEQFTYAYRAVEELCKEDPFASSVCRADCGNPCRALALPPIIADGSCTLASRGPGSRTNARCASLVMSLAALFLRMRKIGKGRSKREIRTSDAGPHR